jgi:hypothetical protein
MLFAAAAIVTAEVLLRKGLGALVGTGFVFSGSDEISSFLFAVGTSWSMAHVLVTRGHVRIDALYIHFGPRTRALLDLFALLVLGIFVAALVERRGTWPPTSYIEGDRSNSPQRLLLAWAQIRGSPASPCSSGPGARPPALGWGAAARRLATARPSPGAITQDEEIDERAQASAFSGRIRREGTGDDRNDAAAADRLLRSACRLRR